MVIANFEGTESYYPSNAAVAFYAGEQQGFTPNDQAQATSTVELYFIQAVIGIIVTIIVVGAAIILLQRRGRQEQ